MSAVLQDKPVEVADEVVDVTDDLKPTQHAVPAVSYSGDPQRTRQVLIEGLDHLSRVVGALPTYDMSDKIQVELAKQHRQLCRDFAGAVENAYKEWIRPFMDARTPNIEARDQALAVATAVRDHIDDQLKADARRKAAEKEARDRAEQARVMGHREAIAAIAAIPEEFTRSSVDDIQAKLTEIEDCATFLASRGWEEFRGQAEDAHRTMVSTMRLHLESAVNRARLAEMEEQQRIAAENRRHEEQLRADEDARVSRLRDRIDEITTMPRTCIGMDAAFINTQIKALEAIDPEQGFAEFRAEACEAKLASLRDMLELHDQAVKREEAERTQARQMSILQRIQGINNAVLAAQAESNPALIQQTLDTLRAMAVDSENFGDMATMAAVARETAVTAITKLLVDAQAAEAARQAELERQAQERRDREAEAARLAELNSRLQANAREAVLHLRTVCDFAQEFGADWLCLVEARAFIARIDPEGKL